MHEMAHGLGFITLSRDSTGAYFFGLPDSYLVNMYDLDFDRSWEQLSNAERLASQVNTHRLVWTGPEVTTRSQFQLEPRFSVIVQPPAPIEGSYEAQPAAFGPQIPLNGGFTGNIKNARDEVGVETDGCEPITNNVRNRVAIIDRGGCEFTQKVANAQAADASAVIIVNDGPGLPPMGGDDPTITIPSVGVSQADGELFKPFAVADPLTQVKFRYDNDFLAGTTGGFVRLYAPNPVDPGSSKSHFDTSATPNLLMEPFINDDLVPATWLDLTVRALKDIGWKLQ